MRLARLGRLPAWIVRRAWLLAALLALWEVGARARRSLFVPPASVIAARLVERWFSRDGSPFHLSRAFVDNVLPSLERLAAGWAIAVVVGVLGGLLLGRVWQLNALFQPVIRLGMSTPSVIVLPLALVIFGVTDAMNVLVISYGSLWPVLVNTIDGVQHIDPAILLASRSLRLRRWDTFRWVLLPAASPRILVGLRVSLGIAVVLMVTSEMYAATRGLGVQIIFAQKRLLFADMWAGIVLAGVVGVTVNAVFGLLERRLTRWRPDPMVHS